MLSGTLPVPSVFPPSAEFQPLLPVQPQPWRKVVSAPAPRVQEKEQQPTVTPSLVPLAPPKPSILWRPTLSRRTRQPEPSSVSCRNPCRSTRFDSIYSKYLSLCATSAACPPPSHFSFLFTACSTQPKKYTIFFLENASMLVGT